MKSMIGFLFFLLFMAGFALVSLQARQAAPNAEAADVSELADTAWRPLRIFGNTVSPEFGQTVEFSSDGRLYGNGGCNRYSGRYEYADDRFRVASMRATTRECDDPVTATERQLFDVFRDAREVEFVDENLRFLNEDGQWLATLEAVNEL